MNAPTAFREAVERWDIDAVRELLAPDIEFHSPATFHPFVGRETVGDLLEIVGQTFEDFRYTDELAGRGHARADIPGCDRRAGDRGHRPAADERGRPDRRLHGHAPPDLRPAPVRAGDGREGRRRGPADDARLTAAAGVSQSARTALLGLGSNVGDRRSHLQAAVDGAAARRRRGPGELEHLRHRPRRGGARPAELPERVRAARRRRSSRSSCSTRSRRSSASSAARAARSATGRAAIDIDILLLGDVSLQLRAHDAPSRAAALAPIRADPGARARLRAHGPGRHAAWPTRWPAWVWMRACAGPGRRSRWPGG